MASAIMNKVWNLLGMKQAEEDYEEENDIYDNDYYEEDEQEPAVEEKKGFIKRNKVVAMPQQSVRMVISQPTTF